MYIYIYIRSRRYTIHTHETRLLFAAAAAAAAAAAVVVSLSGFFFLVLLLKIIIRAGVRTDYVRERAAPARVCVCVDNAVMMCQSFLVYYFFFCLYKTRALN